ncbi:CaiF/GrlA family transcriptional regulator [Serratia marcescens]|uniref:CaiF/GrlA family transcriptional regulator n=1 Tax=Serratia marcescens TaxID=615 RepID=UPI000B76BBA0|nr:CaiF/GrlA family transcriptional regulator [Serratia marcescens]
MSKNTSGKVNKYELPTFLGGGHSRVAPRQSNHDGYMLPTCLNHLPPMPLYLAVAHFGLLNNEPLTRELICQAFCIDTRRALEVMRYLINGAPHVNCEYLSLMQGKGCRLRILGISSLEHINDGIKASKAESYSRGSTAEREQKQQQLRQWFLRRPNPQ